MQSICFILNSQKKGIRNLYVRVGEVFSSGYKVTFKYTLAAGDAERLAREAAYDGCSVVVAVGGDGTVNEVANGIASLPEDVGQNVTIAVFPWGTGNDFARSIGATPSLARLKQLIDGGNSFLIDAAAVAYSSDGEMKKRYMFNVGDVGIGPHTVRVVERIKRIVGPTAAFWIGGFCSIFLRKAQRISIVADGFRLEGRAKAVCMANGRFFGSGLGIAPTASLCDGKLCLVIVGDVTPFTFLRFTGKLRRAEPVIHPKVQYISTSSCYISSIDGGECLLELDGEILGSSPVRLEMEMARVRFYVDTLQAKASFAEQLCNSEIRVKELC